jgi:tetratricopeptide (TPR) repeat protein
MTQRQPASEFRYWAFISYSHRDKSWGRWLHKALETYRVPKRLVGMPVAAGKIPSRLSPVFRDRDELPTTSDLGSAIEEALRQSWCLIVICSPESAQSRWVNEEVLAFQRLGRGDRIHCLIVDSGNDAAAPLVFPPALGPRLDTDGGRIGEPVAADARRFGDGRTSAKLKLIAGILGIGYDSLVQREHQRRHRNLFYVTCASLALVIVLAVSTLVAITSRRDAVDQRSHAESLVEFMIGDLRKKLEPDGKLATLDAVGKEALAYYASQKSEDLDADGLARRARALHMIGEVYDLRGELDEALKVFEQAADSTKELVGREPENGQRIFDHAQSVYWVGYIAYQRGNIEVAEPAFQDYKRLAERLIAIEPTNEDWQAEVGYANSNLGTLLYEQGRFDSASAIFASELDSATHLGEKDPREFKRQMRIAQANARLANIRYVQGRFPEAADYRKAEISIYDRVNALNPKNNESREAQSISERSLARILLEMGETSAAINQLQLALAGSLHLIEVDNENANWIESTAAAFTALAEAYEYVGATKNAKEAIRRAKELTTQLVERDPSVVAWQLRKLAATLVEARQKVSAGETPSAIRMAQDIVHQIELLPKSELRNWELTNLLVQAFLLIGESNYESKRKQEAANAWLKVVEIVDSDTSNPILKNQAALAIALLSLGRKDQARMILRKLSQMGYREPGYLKLLGESGLPTEENSP